MRLSTALTGGFPRTRRFASFVRKYEKGEASREELKRVALEQILKVYERLAGRLPDYITDGMYLCDDILNPFIRDITGVEIGGLVRFYENNFFVRQPVVVGDIRLSESPTHTLERLEIALRLKEKLNREVRLPFPGPATFADFSLITNNSPYSTRRELMESYIEVVLLPLIKLLKAEGAILELEDPSLPRLSNEELRAYVEKMQSLSKSELLRIHLIVYFNGVPKVVAERLGEVLTLGLDLVEAPQSISAVLGPPLKSIQLGVINARTTLLEEVKPTSDRIKSAIRSLAGVERVLLSTNTTLEFLPERIAFKKLKVLHDVKHLLEEW
uniref:Cobalamin-independent methionine synthase MetE N-terminal domain-containing protein n=1 Tax=Fervidicoccus fontis TaxID=683846 RepID=A0A7J3ZIX0_9CREN